MSVYTIAGLPFEVEGSVLDAPLFHNYHPFRTDVPTDAPRLFTMRFGKVERPAEAECHVYPTPRGRYIVWWGDEVTAEFRLEGATEGYRMRVDRSWSDVVADRSATGVDPSTLDELVMMAFIYSASFHRCVSLHASCVKVGADGVAFVGESGAGKSTHSALWLQNVEGATLLNDDQPLVRLAADGTPYLYGTPWSGKTPCYRNERARLTAFFRMVQAAENRVERMTPVEAFRQLLASCALVKDDRQTYEPITEICAALARIPMYRLYSRPEAAAVRLTYAYSLEKIRV